MRKTHNGVSGEAWYQIEGANGQAFTVYGEVHWHATDSGLGIVLNAHAERRRSPSNAHGLIEPNGINPDIGCSTRKLRHKIPCCRGIR